jgi:hypothetical protein
MVQDDDLNSFPYPEPGFMPGMAGKVEFAYAVDGGESAQAPDVSPFFPPAAPGDDKTEATDDDNGLRRLDTLKANGLSELELEKLREKLREGFSAVIDEVFASLTADAKPAAAAAVPALNQEMDLRTLMAASRRGESLTRNGRELAEDIVIGSLANWGNEVWDPNDPATNSPAEKNFLLALLRQ